MPGIEKLPAAGRLLELARVLSFIWIALFLGLGCQIPRALARNDIDESAGEIRVRSVRLINGTEIDFRSDPPGYAVLRDSANVRTLDGGMLVELPLDSVQFEGSTRYPTTSENGMQNLIIGATIAGVFVWLMTHPFQFHQ